MNLRNALLTEHSKINTQFLADYIGNDVQRFADLMHLLLNDEPKVTQRAGWVMSYCVEKYPDLLLPYLKPMIQNLQEKKDLHNAIKRHTMRAFCQVDFEEDLLGRVADIGFNYLSSMEEPVAVKIFSMTVLGNICQKEPDLAQELKLTIEAQMPYGSAGFHSRGKRILALLEKIRKEKG